MKDTIKKWLEEHPLDIGDLTELRKGQKDFASWGDGIVVGSREWVADKLSVTLASLHGRQLSFIPTVDYEWQQSRLSGFTVRIQASLPDDRLAGYYLGRIDDDLYGLFGFGIDVSEEKTAGLQ